VSVLIHRTAMSCVVAAGLGAGHGADGSREPVGVERAAQPLVEPDTIRSWRM